MNEVSNPRGVVFVARHRTVAYGFAIALKFIAFWLLVCYNFSNMNLKILFVHHAHEHSTDQMIWVVVD